MATLDSKVVVLAGGQGAFVEGEQMPRGWFQTIGKLLPEGESLLGYTMRLRLKDFYAELDIDLVDTTSFTVYVPREQIAYVFNPDPPTP